MSESRSDLRKRIIQFSVLCVLCVAGALSYVYYSRAKFAAPPAAPSSPPATSEERNARAPTAKTSESTEKSAAAAKPQVADKGAGDSDKTAASKPVGDAKVFLLFRITALRESYGQVGRMNVADPSAPVFTSALNCERLHFAAGSGLCLSAERRIFAGYNAIIFNRDFAPRHQLRLNGMPTRVRVAPNGRHAAYTVFVSGHSYADASFSTLTSFVDLTSGETLVEDMEKFTVTRDGERLQAPDFNFWGVTFKRNPNEFYATLATGGRTFLVDGDLAARQAKLLRPDVECPALSPDNNRLVFKKRIGGAMGQAAWRLSVLDLRTRREQQLAETRSVDDHVEWLDNDTVLYSLPAAQSGSGTDVWAIPVHGSGAPRLLVPQAYSPVVMRE